MSMEKSMWLVTWLNSITPDSVEDLIPTNQIYTSIDIQIWCLPFETNSKLARRLTRHSILGCLGDLIRLLLTFSKWRYNRKKVHLQSHLLFVKHRREKKLCLFEEGFSSYPRIFHSFGDVTIAG